MIESVRDIMIKDLLTISENETALKAAQIMSEKGVSSLIVLADNQPIGIVTERDFIKNYLGPTLQSAGMSDKKIIAWDHFRGYLVSSKRPYIYLLSKYYPTAIGFSFAPTSNEDFDLIIGEIKKHLSNCDFISYDQEVSIFMNIYFQAVFLSLALLLIELIGLIVSIAIGIILNSLLMYLHTIISLRIINRIIPTDKFPVAEIE